MSDTETLRRAATLMRERAEEATPGPWFALYDEPWSGREQLAHDYDAGRVSEVEYMDAPDSPATLFHGDVVHKPDTAHIASWHPGVALAVADWLDTCARLYEYGDVGRIQWDKALAVAHAYLGEEGAWTG